MEPEPEPWKIEVKKLAAEGRMDEAVKLVREHTLLGLTEARDFVTWLLKE